MSVSAFFVNVMKNTWCCLERRNQGRSRLLDQTDRPGGDLAPDLEPVPESYKSTLTAFGHHRELSETSKSCDEKLREFQLSSPETVNDRDHF